MSKKTLKYKKEFNPTRVYKSTECVREAGDQRVCPIYVFDDDIVLAVNVALATRRPLLIRGPSGCGKSSLARSVAEVLGWRYYETVVTSRTQARDLCWEVDLLRRLHDAQNTQARLTEDYTPYVIPRALWWAFDRESAVRRGGARGQADVLPVTDPSRHEHRRAVILIDEIDKADPDVPNNLLVPLGSLQFQVEETGFNVCSNEDVAPLVFITTNDERELPAAFLRRCVELNIGWPTRSRLIEIGSAHIEDLSRPAIRNICKHLLGDDDGKAQENVGISAAEFVDTLKAYRKLQVRLGSREWKSVCSATAWKHGRKGPAA